MAKKLKEWFDGDCATLLGRAIAQHHTAFDVDGYAVEVERGVASLELKERVGLMSDALRARLPADFEEAATILVVLNDVVFEEETLTGANLPQNHEVQVDRLQREPVLQIQRR